MAQLIINTGAAANDGTGDPLRTAFTETNTNFTAIFTAGPVDSNVRIVDNTILTLNTNGNLVLAPNGVGKVVANVDIVPNSSNIRNLGSGSNRWSTVYSQYLNISGATNFSSDVTVTGNLTVTGDSIELGNIITDALTIQLGNTASTDLLANGAGVTVGSNDDIATILYNASGDIWTTNIGISAAGNVTAPYFIGDGSQLTGLSGAYANANVVSYAETGWAGNIIPSADNTYSLGNATNQWSELHVANATIYIGGVALGVAGNVLTVDGEPVLSNDSTSSITTTGNITADHFIGNISAANVTGLATVATTGAYSDLSGTPTLATVATSGSYNDLSNKPTIPTLGNFSLTNNTIQTGNGVGGITLSIFGPDQGVPDPAFIFREWTFANTGAFTAPGSLNGTSASVTGNVTAAGNIYANYMNITHDISANYIDAVANIAAGNVIVLDTFWGGAVSVTGNVDGGNVNATGNVTATSFIGDGSQLTGFATVATSGAYSDLSGAPTTVSSFTNDANYVASNVTGITGADQVTNMVSLTQAEYDAITPNASTVYFIVG